MTNTAEMTQTNLLFKTPMNCHSLESTASVLKTITKRKKNYLKLETTNELAWWCGGCGNYGIEKAVLRALALENINPQNILFAFDVGCNGNESDKLGTYTVHGLHGRVIPLASGAAIANTKIKVIATAGDGATFSEGVNHLVHAVRNDYPIVFIVHNNENYGLTIGQASATTRKGFAMNASPDGVVADPINLCEFVLGLNPTFVARSFSGDVKHMTAVIQEGLKHNGFAFIEIMQTCPTYNKATSQAWFWERIKYLEDVKAYEKADIREAKKYATDVDDKIYLGVLHQKQIPNFMERLVQRKGVKTVLTEEVKNYDISKIIQEFV